MCMEFRVVLTGGTEQLIKLTDDLAEKGINLTTIAMEKVDDNLSVRFYPSNVDLAREILTSLGVKFCEKEVILVEMEDRLGQYAAVARKLIQSDIEILASHLLTRKMDKMQLIFEVNKLDIAKRILGDQITELDN